MTAPATRANLLSAQIDKAAILASYEQGLFAVGHLSLLLDNFVALQGFALNDADIKRLLFVRNELDAMSCSASDGHTVYPDPDECVSIIDAILRSK